MIIDYCSRLRGNGILQRGGFGLAFCLGSKKLTAENADIAEEKIEIKGKEDGLLLLQE